MAEPTWAGRDERLRLADGRSLLVRHYGDPAGRPLLMLHGTPGARLKFVGSDPVASRLGLHVVAPDRWAYGGTDAPAVPSLHGFADEIADLMARLGAPRFAVAGVSGGGPYATALAAVRPDRVTALALISPVGLVAESAAAGEVAAFHRFCFGPLAARPRLVEAIFGAYGAAVRRAPALACRLTTLRAPPADCSIMADSATSTRLLATFAEGLSRSTRGPAIDLALFRELASLDLAAVRAPARVWIGTRDTNVPVDAARRLAQRLPRARLTELPDAGHLWVAHHYDQVLGWIAGAIPARADRPSPSPPRTAVRFRSGSDDP